MNALAGGRQIFGVFGRQIRKCHVPFLLIGSMLWEMTLLVWVCDHIDRQFFQSCTFLKILWLGWLKKVLRYSSSKFSKIFNLIRPPRRLCFCFSWFVCKEDYQESDIFIQCVSCDSKQWLVSGVIWILSRNLFSFSSMLQRCPHVYSEDKCYRKSRYSISLNFFSDLSSKNYC